MIEIPLPNDLVTLVDDDDADLVAGRHWRAAEIGLCRYVTTSVKKPDGRPTTLYMHRLILGSPAGRVDHINRDGLDNRRSNLRVATPSQNAANAVGHQAKKSGLPKGVFPRGDDRFQARIGAESTSLGTFGTVEEAVEAYRVAAIARWGEFARIEAA